jgi:hypothetical protein
MRTVYNIYITVGIKSVYGYTVKLIIYMIIRPGRGRGCCVVILCSHNADHNKRRTALCDTSWNIKAKIKISFSFKRFKTTKLCLFVYLVCL